MEKEIKYHEHELVRVEKPALKQAKSLCLFVLAICAGGSLFYLQASPATRAVIDQYDTWPCMVVGVIVVIVALRASLS